MKIWSEVRRMDLKKSYAEKYGYERVITARNSVLAFTEIDMLKLAEGKSVSVSEQGKEFALMVLGGTCAVKGSGFCFEKVGRRKTPFEGVAEGVYIGKTLRLPSRRSTGTCASAWLRRLRNG